MNKQLSAPGSFLTGKGEMADLVRSKDWSKTPLGPIELWPQSLKTTVSLCLASKFPISITWGPQHTQIYNDGYRVSIGNAHPAALGEDYRVTWTSAWPAVGEPFSQALEGEPSFLENQRMFLERNGYLEETFFTFSMSPIHDESGGVGGLFHPSTETTLPMLAERRSRAVRDLTAALIKGETTQQLAELSVDTLTRFEFDLPFVLVYVREPSGDSYRLAAHHGIEAGSTLAPPTLNVNCTAPWPVDDALAERSTVEVDGIEIFLPDHTCGPYEEPPQCAFMLPIAASNSAGSPMLVMAGTSRCLPLDDLYRDFFESIALCLTVALISVQARDAERRSLEALAVIDRAKTAFFSNVSHEFRTPLTLMVSPLEELVQADNHTPDQRDLLVLVQRNSRRLMKLVNSLLEFSRIEAGRATASYVQTDIALLTADIVSSFRSATDRAGLALRVESAEHMEPVYLDHDLWEKVILNLLSNAFRATLEGEIVVRVRPSSDGTAVEVTVQDTGTGIAADQLPRLFERFYRIEGAPGRSIEGTGIGLSLVEEMVKLHGGSVRVESELEHGSTFTVSIPFGLPKMASALLKRTGGALQGKSPRGGAFVEEALQWVTKTDAHKIKPQKAELPSSGNVAVRVRSGHAGHVLLADDNADMRAYIERLLMMEGFSVESVTNGQEALEAARRLVPDLLLSDVMMPLLDGFGLLHEVRQDPLLKDIPFVLLSARAGEEARVEGLRAGADDYLIKPFFARELLARVSAMMTLSRERRLRLAKASQVRIDSLEANLERRVVEQAQERGRTWQLSSDLMGVVNVDGRFESVNPAWQRLLGWTEQEIAATPFLDLVHPEDIERTQAVWDTALSGVPIIQFENRFRAKDQSYHWLSWVSTLEGNKIYCSGRDFTQKKQRADELVTAQEALRQAQKLEAIGKLTGGVAHDFNNLLTVIRGSVELLRRFPDLPMEKRSRYVEVIADTVTRAAKLTGQLLAFARRQTLKPEVLDVNASVYALGQMLATLVGPHISLKQDLSKAACFVHSDATQFDTALLNLVVNASDATNGHGALTIRSRAVSRVPALRQNPMVIGEYVAVTVTDQGTGIAALSLDQIFEPFFTTKKIGQGTGLGLSQVFGFVKQSGGEIRVDSELGKGSTFSIYLPRVPAPVGKDQVHEEVAAPPQEGSGIRVLVVEDNRDVGAFTRQSLSDWGFEATLAPDGATALDTLQRNPMGFDVVFSDVVMPGMTGIELGQAIRLQYPGLPVILTSGYSPALATGGAQGFELIDKPYSIESVTRVLAGAARHH
jgi:PAS domain S-box-containing protein